MLVNLTIDGITAMDLMELRPEFDAKGVRFSEAESHHRGHSDMGVFTIGVPITIAVVRLLEKWIASRTPVTEISYTPQAGSTITMKTSGHEMDPEDLERFLTTMRNAMQ
jgi:hypothetical protein